MDFVCDIHIARKVVSELRLLGFDAIHASDLMGTDSAVDEDIGARADALGACVITKDKKFRKLNEDTSDNYVPQRIITLDDMNSRTAQVRLMLRRHAETLATLVAAGEPFSYLMDRFGGFRPTDSH